MVVRVSLVMAVPQGSDKQRLCLFIKDTVSGAKGRKEGLYFMQLL